MNHGSRQQRVREAVAEAGIDALLVTNLTNVRYLTGFSGSNVQVLVTQAGAVFLTDPRYRARAADLVEEAEIDVYPARLSDLLPAYLERHSIRRLGVEAATMTLAERDDLASAVEPAELVSQKAIVERLRRTKDPDEIALMEEAVRLSDDAFAWLLERLEPGRTEREIALELEVHMRTAGADDVSFDPIVGSGELSAHIHHTPSERPLQKGDLVLFDLGARYRGYCSDLTRTVVLGPATDEQGELYDLVLRAQRAGLEAVAPGRRATEVDAAARSVIEEAGRGDDFGHGLGHGVGLDIHEAPRLNRITDEVLVEGDVVTIEPGVYRVGRGGVRIEDCVLVTDEGARVLGGAPKDELLEL